MVFEYYCQVCGKHRRVHRAKGASTPKFCSRACKVEDQRRQAPVFTREWLHQKYIVEGLGCRQIGELVDRDEKTILYWLRKHEIQTRPRGYNHEENLLNGRPTGWHHTEQTKRKAGKASRERGAVPYLRNGKHYLEGQPPEANPNWKGGITSERQSYYNSRAWKKVSKAVWVRDDAKCQRCGLDARDADREETGFHVHHIISFAVEEVRTDPDNLVLLCSDCHYWVHSNANTDGEFLAEPHRNGSSHVAEGEGV